MNNTIEKLIQFAVDENTSNLESEINITYKCAKNSVPSFKSTMEFDFMNEIRCNVFEFSTKTSPNCIECSEILMLTFPSTWRDGFLEKYNNEWLPKVQDIKEPTFGANYSDGVFLTLIWAFD